MEFKKLNKQSGLKGALSNFLMAFVLLLGLSQSATAQHITMQMVWVGSTSNTADFDILLSNTSSNGATLKFNSIIIRGNHAANLLQGGTGTISWAPLNNNTNPEWNNGTAQWPNVASCPYTAGSRLLNYGSSTAFFTSANAPTIPTGTPVNIGRFRMTVTGGTWVSNSQFGFAFAPTAGVVCYINGAPTTSPILATQGTSVNRIAPVSQTLNAPSGPTASVLSGNSTICNGSSANLSVAITGGTSPYTVVYSDGIDNFTVSNYVSGTNIPVTPSATTTYTLVSVTDNGNNIGTSNTGNALVTVNEPTSHITVATACDSYVWAAPLGDGQTYTSSQNGITHTSVNAAGCTHTETLNLTINNSTSHTTIATACDSYVWATPLGNGQTYTSSQNGITHTSVNAAGCTHTETLNLTINSSTSNTTVATACDSYVWAAPLGNGQTYTSSQNGITHTSVNAAGCTHTETLNLTINSSTSHTTNATATACEAYVWEAPLGNGQTYTSPQTGITHTSVNAAGCTHTETLNLSFTSQALWYLDADNDGYYTGSAVSSCASPGAGYTTSFIGSGDCNDNNSDVNPGAAEICYNNIDDNCNLTLSEGCAPVVVNMTASYHNMALPSMSTAIPAVAYSYGGFTNLKYRFTVTNTTTGTTAPDVIQTSRYITIPASIHSYNASYTIRVSAVINEEIVPHAGNIITVHSPSVQLVTLSTASCGATLASLSSTLTANAGLNATGYTFRIRLNDANPTPTYALSQSATRFVGANSFTGFPLQYSSSYRVSVQYTFNDPVTGLPVQSGYGAECTVNTPSIPVTSIASPACNSTVAALSATVSAASASYATGYQFRIRLFSDNGSNPTYYTTAVSTSRFSSLSSFQGITLAYSTEYAISVRYSMLNGSTTVWSNYGSECKVTTPFFPTTSLVPSQCGSTTVATALNQQLNITPYPGNPNYRVLLEELTGEDVTNSQELVVTVPNFRLNQFSIAENGKNYSISVAIKLNGVFGDYSTACDLHTGEVTAGELQKETKPEFKATAYPNPFASNFMLDVKTSAQSSVNIKVYDMIGRIVEQKEVRVSDLESTTIGSQYPSGVYNVVVSQDDNVQTVRVIKR